MSAAIAAAGVAAVGGAIAANQAKQAQKGAINAQKSAANAASQIERERLQQEAQQYQEQMQEYRRKQTMSEKQMQQTIVNLAPYIQGGQGALYQMFALAGIEPPAGANMPTAEQPTISAMRGGLAPSGASTGNNITAQPVGSPVGLGVRGTMTNLGIPAASTVSQFSPAAAEFGKGGLSLSSARWKNVNPEAGPRAAAALMLQQVQQEMPNATDQEQQNEAIARLNAQASAEQQQSLINEARNQVPTVATAENPFAGMSGQEAQAMAINQIAQSPLLQELMAQGETGILQNAAATGGLRGGRTQAALAQFRPQMLQQEIDKQYGRLQGLSGLGQQSILSSPTIQPGAAPTYRADTSGLVNAITQGGQAQAGGILSGAQTDQNMWNNIGKSVGWGLEKYSQGGFFPNQQTPTPALDYANMGFGNPNNY